MKKKKGKKMPRDGDVKKQAKSARQSVELDRLLDFLGIDRGLDSPIQSEAVYYACLKVLSESIGKIPFKIQQATAEKGVRVAREHPYYRTINERPNRYMTASAFWALMEYHRNDYGNAYAWIDSSDPERLQLWPLDPWKVDVLLDDACRLDEQPDIYYRVQTAKGPLVLGSEEVLHYRSHHTHDGIVGISVRHHLASLIQGNAKAQEFIGKLYDTGMTAKMVLQYTGSLSETNVQSLREGIENYARGDLKKGLQNVIPIPYGMTITPLNLKLADSQFLEIKQYTALQIAAAMGVKPYQIGDYSKSSYASAEAQQLSFLVDTLLYNIKHYEEETSYKILSVAEEAAGYHVKANTAVILRADQQTQIQTLAAAVNSFLMTPNEARERLDLPAKEGGDRLLGNGSSIPVQLTGAQYTELFAQDEKEGIQNGKKS